MKPVRYLIALFILAGLLGSCKKEQGQDCGTAALKGTWELREVRGDMPLQTYAPGNGNLILFNETEYAVYTNGTPVKNGLYHLEADNSVQESVGLVIPDGQFTRRIVYENDLSGRKTFMEISGNKLTLLSGYFPLDSGSEMVYERVSSNSEIVEPH